MWSYEGQVTVSLYSLKQNNNFGNPRAALFKNGNAALC